MLGIRHSHIEHTTSTALIHASHAATPDDHYAGVLRAEAVPAPALRISDRQHALRGGGSLLGWRQPRAWRELRDGGACDRASSPGDATSWRRTPQVARAPRQWTPLARHPPLKKRKYPTKRIIRLQPILAGAGEHPTAQLATRLFNQWIFLSCWAIYL